MRYLAIATLAAVLFTTPVVADDDDRMALVYGVAAIYVGIDLCALPIEKAKVDRFAVVQTPMAGGELQADIASAQQEIVDESATWTPEARRHFCDLSVQFVQGFGLAE